MKKLIAIVLCSLMMLPQYSFAASTQVDALIKKLVEKKILTKQEAMELKGELAADEKMLREEGLKQSLPSWVQDMKIKGDLRLRFQNERRESTNVRDRARIRMRLGVETKANDKVKVAVGIATGAGDPRSTNETLENAFEKSDIRLDYAYAEYTPGEWGAFTGGKVPKPFWNPKDLVFDTDLTFDGGAAMLKRKLNDKIDMFFNTGLFVLDENATENYDPYMYGGQLGINVKTTQNTSLKLAESYYAFDKIRNYAVLPNRTASNTTFTAGGLTRYNYDYDAFATGAEFAVAMPFGLDWIPQWSFFGELLKAQNSSEHDMGYLLGSTIGDKKVVGPRQWQLGYNFRRLERNAFLDNFHDSDFYGGATHVQGHEIQLSYGLSKNVSLDLDYYRAAPIGGEEIDTREQTVEHLLQADLNFKF